MHGIIPFYVCDCAAIQFRGITGVSLPRVRRWWPILMLVIFNNCYCCLVSLCVVMNSLLSPSPRFFKRIWQWTDNGSWCLLELLKLHHQGEHINPYYINQAEVMQQFCFLMHYGKLSYGPDQFWFTCPDNCTVTLTQLSLLSFSLLLSSSVRFLFMREKGIVKTIIKQAQTRRLLIKLTVKFLHSMNETN